MLCVHVKDVNFRLLHTWASSFLNHLRAIPQKNEVVRPQSVQGAILQFRAGPATHVRGAIADNLRLHVFVRLAVTMIMGRHQVLDYAYIPYVLYTRYSCAHPILMFNTTSKKRRPDHHRPRTGYGGNPSNVFRVPTYSAGQQRHWIRTNCKHPCANQVPEVHYTRFTTCGCICGVRRKGVFDHWNEVNFRMLHTCRSRDLNHPRDIPKT